jgi:predicted DNA-binding mobile mystery protein A
MASRDHARRHLDAHLDSLRPLEAEGRPPRGWIRSIREALGMSTTELAARMGVSQSRIPELERGEVAGSLKLATLERAADALDCDLVYVLIPRSTLEESVRAQAQRQAMTRLAGIRHTMRLEDQEVGSDDTDDLIDDLASELVDRRGLWTTTTN